MDKAITDRPSGFPFLSEEELNDRSLKPQLKRALNLIRSVSKESGVCYMRQEKMATLLGVDQRTVKRYLRELTRRGLLPQPTRPSRRSANVYDLRGYTPRGQNAEFEGTEMSHSRGQKPEFEGTVEGTVEGTKNSASSYKQ